MALLAGGGSAQLVRDVGSAGSVQGFRAGGELAGARLSSALPFLAGLQAQDGIAQQAQGTAGITGNLAATESGADVAVLAGVVLVQGTVAGQEAGSDTLSCEGTVRVQGDLAAQETGADTFAATGTVGSVITGTLAATESGADTFAGTGTVTSSAVQGDLAATEAGSDSFSGSGTAGKPFGPPDWEYRPNTGGGPIGSMGPFTVQRKRRRPLPVDQQQEDAQEAAADPWSQQFREIALADDAEISEFVFCLVSSGVLDGHV